MSLVEVLAGDDQYACGEVIRSGQQMGQRPEDIDVMCAVVVAVNSGDVELPWSQEFVEETLLNSVEGYPSYDQVAALISMRPAFILVAKEYADLKYA